MATPKTSGAAPYPMLPSGSQQQYLGRPFRAHRSAALNAAANAFTSIACDAADFDPDGCLSGGVYNVPYTGYYLVMGGAQLQLQNNPQEFIMSIVQNGGEQLRGQGMTIRGGIAGDAQNVTVCGIVHCTAGDTLTLDVFNNGGNVCAFVPSSSLVWMAIQQVA